MTDVVLERTVSISDGRRQYRTAVTNH